MRLTLLFITTTLIGCTHHNAPASTQPETVISIGQPWAKATDIARRAGYELHDASKLAMLPAPDGFYVDMSDERGMLVFRDPQKDVVNYLDFVEHWDGPKATRVHHPVQSFDLPPAEPGK